MNESLPQLYIFDEWASRTMRHLDASPSLNAKATNVVQIAGVPSAIRQP